MSSQSFIYSVVLGVSLFSQAAVAGAPTAESANVVHEIEATAALANSIEIPKDFNMDAVSEIGSLLATIRSSLVYETASFRHDLFPETNGVTGTRIMAEYELAKKGSEIIPLLLKNYLASYRNEASAFLELAQLEDAEIYPVIAHQRQLTTLAWAHALYAMGPSALQPIKDAMDQANEKKTKVADDLQNILTLIVSSKYKAYFMERNYVYESLHPETKPTDTGGLPNVEYIQPTHPLGSLKFSAGPKKLSKRLWM